MEKRNGHVSREQGGGRECCWRRGAAESRHGRQHGAGVQLREGGLCPDVGPGLGVTPGTQAPVVAGASVQALPAAPG